MGKPKNIVTEGWVKDHWGWCRLRWTANVLIGAEWFPSVPADFAKSNTLALAWHDRLIKHWRDGAPLDISLSGTPFQIEVWEKLRQIPKGQTTTYGELAAALGKPDAARAVGGAVGENKIGLAVPCHRVVPAQGGLGGFRWGPAMKEAVLRAEGVKVRELKEKEPKKA